jgi:hypothetical protein
LDLLPVGAKPERIQIWLKRLATEMGLKNVRSVHLISAKSGEGVHSLSRVHASTCAETTPANPTGVRCH